MVVAIEQKTHKTEIPFVKRLVVIVPGGELNEIHFAHQVWELAQIHRSNVLFFTVARNDDELMSAQHRMTHLAAATHDFRTPVSTQVDYQASWTRSLKRILRPEDLVVCQADQVIPSLGFWHKPLHELLVQQFSVPVYTLSSRKNGKPSG
jgi:hypothetical protein